MVQDIKITPSGAGDKIPQMLFVGSGATAENMELNVQPDSRLSYESNEGEVFSISSNLQSGVIFAVKDISGLDQISINASGDTYLAPYYGNVRVGATGVIHEDYALDVQGKGLRVGGSGTVLTRASAPAVTTDTLYNVGGSLYFDGSTVGGGSAAGTEAQVQYNDGSSGFAGDAGFTYYKDKAGFKNDRVLVVSGVIVANSGDAAYDNCITIGSGAYLTDTGGTFHNNIVLGTQAWVKNGYSNIVIGRAAYARADSNSSGGSYENVIIGSEAYVSDYHSQYNVVMGYQAQVRSRGDNNVLIGKNAVSGTEHEGYSVYIGTLAGASSDGAGSTAVTAIGSASATFGGGAVALGHNAYAQGEQAISIGFYACGSGPLTTRYGAIALGAFTHTDGPISIAIGHRVVAPANHFVLGSGSAQTSVMLSGVFGSHLALPNGQQFRQIASAAQTTDLMQWQNSAGVNVAAMTPSGVLNVYDVRTSGDDVWLGYNAKGTANYSTIAIGRTAEATGNSSVAIGGGSEANSNYGVAVGGYAETDGNNSVAVGYTAHARHGGSVAIGSQSEVGSGGITIGQMGNDGLADGGGDSAVAIGYYVDADGWNAVAVGAGANAAGHSTIALGHDASSPGDYGVAIGNAAVSHEQTWVIASGATAAAVGISGVFGSYAAIPNDQKLAVGSNVPEYPIDVVTHSGVIRASGVKGCISTNPDAATVTFDLNAATTHAVTLGGNRTLAVSNATVGDKFLIRLQQPTSSAGKTVTWFSHIKWAGGTAPTLTTTASKADLLGFLAASGDGGSSIWYDGFVVGQNI